jgi:RNA recognition motif-containing protein
MNIFVGNLARNVSDEDLKTAFEAFGQVATATVIRDKFTGESRGFGFVEMPAKAEAESAIAELNGKELSGRRMNVNEARPREDRGGGGGGRRPGGGGPGGPGGPRRPGGGGGGFGRGGGGGGGHRSW